MSGIPDDASLEDQLKWRRFADRVDRLFKPSGRKRAELAKALAAYAAAAREARRLAYELWSSETEWFEGCKRQAADEQAIDSRIRSGTRPGSEARPVLGAAGGVRRLRGHAAGVGGNGRFVVEDDFLTGKR